MLQKILFAGTLGILFSFVIMSLLEQPYALWITAPGSLVLGWFANDIYSLIFGDK